MSGVLYYVPRGEGSVLTAAELVDRGLGHVFEAHDEDVWSRDVMRGPDGAGAGVVVAKVGSVPTDRLGFYGDRQRWRPIPGTDMHCGVYADDPPAPQDLVRESILPGHEVRLADGQAWMIPVARGAAEQDGEITWYDPLPRRAGLDADGNWTRDELVPAHAVLWEIALRWWDATLGAEVDEDAGRVTITFEQLYDDSLRALAANYRLGRAEIALMGLFDDEACRRILDALVDVPTIVAFLKKKGGAAESPTAGGSCTGRGSGAGAPATGRR